MKKFLVFLTVICIIATVIVPFGASADSKKQVTVPYLSGANIIVDAEKDSAYTMNGVTIKEQNLFRFPNSPQNSKGTFWLAYDKNFIYLYVDVEDSRIDYSYPNKDETWRRESIGVILDFDYIRTTNYKYKGSENICYVNLSGDNAMVTYHKYQKGTALYNKITRYTVPDTGNGHILYELALPFPKDYKVQGGKKIGFEVSAINANNGDRVGHVSWSEQGSLMDERLDVIGTIVLGDIPGEESVKEDEKPVTPPQNDTPSTEPESKPSSGTSSDNDNPTTSTPPSSDDNGDDTSSYPEDSSNDTSSDLENGTDDNKTDNNGKEDNKDKNDNNDKNSKPDEGNKEDSDKADDDENPTTGTTGNEDGSSSKNNGTTTTTTTTESGGSGDLTVLLCVLGGIIVAAAAAIVVILIIKKKKNGSTD